MQVQSTFKQVSYS